MLWIYDKEKYKLYDSICTAYLCKDYETKRFIHQSGYNLLYRVVWTLAILMISY